MLYCNMNWHVHILKFYFPFKNTNQPFKLLKPVLITSYNTFSLRAEVPYCRTLLHFAPGKRRADFQIRNSGKLNIILRFTHKSVGVK